MLIDLVHLGGDGASGKFGAGDVFLGLVLLRFLCTYHGISFGVVFLVFVICRMCLWYQEKEQWFENDFLEVNDLL
jgi:hypothetical protein